MRVLLASLSMLFLVASGTADAPSDGQAADGVQGSDRSSVSPGQWEITTELTSLEAPGAPEAMVRQLRDQLAGQRQVRSECITPEQARNPWRHMTGQPPSSCEFSETLWSEGNIRIRAACRSPGAPRIEVSIDGTYTARRVDGRIDMSLEMPDPTGAGTYVRIRIQGQLTGRRTGDCARGPGDPPGD